MEYNEALDQTFNHFKINAKAVADRAGISAQTISDYRRGRKDLSTRYLKKILNNLQEEEKKYFSRLAGISCEINGDVRKQLDQMTAEELSQLVVAIGQRIPQISRQRELQNA